MKTEVIMKRELFGSEISQSSKTSFFSLTDLVSAGNSYRAKNNLPHFELSHYVKTKSFIEFKEELERKYGEVYKPGRGRGNKTWAHPLIFIDVALAIDPKLKVEVYEWMFDNLIKFRNDSGDSFREMSAALYTRYNQKREFPKYIQRVSLYIKKQLGVDDWETATEFKLKKRDKIHEFIKLLCNVLKDTDKAVLLGVKENL